MPLVYAGICSHAPGITGRAERADPALRDAFYEHLSRMGEELRAERPDALIVVAAEHFANFFMDNMPAYCMGMADYYEGPIEDPEWLGIQPHRVPGNADLSHRLIERVMDSHRPGLCPGVEIRPRHHGAVALSDAGIRRAGDSREHQLPGAAADAAAPGL